MVTREEFYVDSADGIHMIHGYRWYDPERKPKAILQIVHGMLEYIDRYDELARYMVSEGYYVIGHDHLGHGDSVSHSSELGYVGKHGAVLWLRDIEQIRKMAAAYMPKLPYIMLGHSMGSYLVRRYLIYHGKKVNGAIIMGTGHQPTALIKAGLLITYATMIRKGTKGQSKLLNHLTCSGFAKQYPDNARTGSWMSRDPQVLLSALKDKKMNYDFTLNAFESLFRTIEEVIDPKRASRMPKTLPLLILSGDEDPVGENGKGIVRFRKMLTKIGMKNISCMMYPGNRHELINDLDKKQVFLDIRDWCDSVVKEV